MNKLLMRRKVSGKEFKRQKGFTLVELMIVVAVMAIMSAFAFPAYRSWMVKNRLKGAARQVMSDLMEARMKAASQNNRFKVIFLDSHRYQILDDDNNNGAEDGGELTQTKDIQVDYYDVTFTANNDPIFNSSGTVSNLVTVTLTNPSGSKSVTVSSAGRVLIN